MFNGNTLTRTIHTLTMPSSDVQDTPPLSAIAADLYMRQRHDSGFLAISKESGISVDDLQTAWSTRPNLLKSYYSDAFRRYTELESSVPDFKQYNLSEKLATLIFSLSDELEHIPGFASETFSVLAYDASASGSFGQLVFERIRWFIDSDQQVSSLANPIINKTSSKLLQKVIMMLIFEHLRDPSPDKEYSSALIDKTTTFIESLYYSGITDKAIDLAKYLTINYRRR